MRLLRHPFVLFACAALWLGGCASTRYEPADPRPAQPVARPAPAPASTPSTSAHRVVKGDTLYGIAFRNGLDFRDLAQWNRIDPPYTIYIGQSLRLTPPGVVAASNAATRPAAATQPPSRTTAARPATTTPGPATTPATAPTTASAAPTVPATAASAGAVTTAPAPAAQRPDLPPSGSVSFRWPLQGPLLQRFIPGDKSRAGIDIGAAAGSEVRAAADGEVVYSGNGLMLYGELIIIKHSNSLLSAYARNGKRLVEEGARVKAGQAIAQIGSARPSLHFEIRRDGKPVNPLDYLPPR